MKSVKIKTPAELGALIRHVRMTQHFTLESVSGISGVGMRFLSELERGKETVQLCKVLEIIHQLGLEVIIQPRSQHRTQMEIIADE